MATRELDRAEWAAYFDAFSHRHIRDKRIDYAEIRVFSEEDGAQRETAWLPLDGITYDPKSDLLEIIVEDLDHLVYHPETVHVQEVEGRLATIQVVRRDGTREIVELR